MGTYHWRRMKHKLAKSIKILKEPRILQHYYFPWDDVKFYIKKEEDKLIAQHSVLQIEVPANKHLTYQSIAININ